MPLLRDTLERVTKAFTRKTAAAQVIARLNAVESIGKVAKFGTTTNVRTDTVANLGADTEARLDNIEAKINAILTAATVVD